MRNGKERSYVRAVRRKEREEATRKRQEEGRRRGELQ